MEQRLASELFPTDEKLRKVLVGVTLPETDFTAIAKVLREIENESIKTFPTLTP